MPGRLVRGIATKCSPLSSTEGVSTARAMKDSCVTKTGTFLRARDLDTMFSGLVTSIRAVGCPSHFRGTRQSALSSEHRNQRLFYGRLKPLRIFAGTKYCISTVPN
jgi:hypothetical protein